MRGIFLSLFLVSFSLLRLQIHAQSSIDTHIAVNSQTDDKTFVVIICNENYKHEESVPFARNDGEVFGLYCEKTLGIPQKNIRIAPDATLNEMNYQLDWLSEVLQAYDGEARAIIYYTGHGMPDERSKEAYLLPVDGYSKSAQSGLSTRTLYHRLSRMASGTIMVLLDACFSGAQRDGQMLSSSRGVAMRAKDETVGQNTVVFSAAQGDETAYPYNAERHGLFTYYVLEKLRATGGATTLGELSDYVTQQVKRKSVVENGKSQTPSVVAAADNEGWRDWPFAKTAATNFEDRAAADPDSSTRQVAVAPKPESRPGGQQPAAAAVSQARPDAAAPALDESATEELVTKGRKAMRAMDYKAARKSLTQAAGQGSIEAYYQLGLLYSNSNFDGYNRETATSHFLKAAGAGHVEATYQTGMMFIGTDNETAKSWLQKAADKGHSGARSQLQRLR